MTVSVNGVELRRDTYGSPQSDGDRPSWLGSGRSLVGADRRVQCVTGRRPWLSCALLGADGDDGGPWARAVAVKVPCRWKGSREGPVRVRCPGRAVGAVLGRAARPARPLGRALAYRRMDPFAARGLRPARSHRARRPVVDVRGGGQGRPLPRRAGRAARARVGLGRILGLAGQAISLGHLDRARPGWADEIGPFCRPTPRSSPYRRRWPRRARTRSARPRRASRAWTSATTSRGSTASTATSTSSWWTAAPARRASPVRSTGSRPAG